MKKLDTASLIARSLLWWGAALALPVNAWAEAPPAWGAIAAAPNGYGYSYSHPSRAAAEQAAIESCERALAKSRPGHAKGKGNCVVRTAFDHRCGALATGNYGEWGIATAASEAAAKQDAVKQCNSHLPTEPCKVTVGICSLN